MWSACPEEQSPEHVGPWGWVSLVIITQAHANLPSGSMGKLVNPFASHAKDPQFEPGWNHFVFYLLIYHIQLLVRNINLISCPPTSESVMWLAFVGKLVNPFAWHAKDRQFESGRKHFVQLLFCAGNLFGYSTFDFSGSLRCRAAIGPWRRLNYTRNIIKALHTALTFVCGQQG